MGTIKILLKSVPFSRIEVPRMILVLSASSLKMILPHHGLYRLDGTLGVLGVLLSIVIVEDFSIDFKVNQLTYRHASINAYRLCDGNF